MLEGLAADIRAFGFRRVWFQRDQVSRFAQPDLQEAIRLPWEHHAGLPDVQLFLLELIHQGALRDCADLARMSVFGAASGHRVLIAAGRALSAAGTEQDRRDLAALVIEQASELPAQMVWDAVEDLFPTVLGTADLLTIVERSGPVDDILVNGLQHAGADYVSRIEATVEVEALIAGLIGIAKAHATISQEAREDIVPALLAAADRRLAEAPPDACPELAVDAILIVGRAHAFRGSATDLKPDPRARLEETWQRRRAAFWRAVDAWNADMPVGTREIEVPHGVQFLGLALPQLREDFDWVLADLTDQPAGARGSLALALALHVWRASGEDAGLLDTLRRTAAAAGLSA